MMIRLSYIGLFTFIAFLVVAGANEPSAFGGGKEIATPIPPTAPSYTLTTTEEDIVANKKEIENLKKRFFELQTQFNSLKERLAGLESVVEGLDEELNLLKKEFKKADNNKISQEIALLRKDFNTTIALQKENFEKIKSILKQLTSMIDKINASYVTKDEFQKELTRIYAKLGETPPQPIATIKDASKLYQLARAAYKKGDYKRAKELFDKAIEKKYKPATSSFYAGESCYYTKDYACALRYYRKSASLYRNAPYMPILLLHTGIALEKLGEKEKAKTFFKSVIQVYPKSKAAKIAKEHLLSL